MGGPEEYYTKWNKTERQITYMWTLKSTKQKKIIKKRLAVMGGQYRGGGV